MDDKTYHKYQVIISIITLIGGCLAFFVTAYVGVQNIISQQRHEQRLEFKKVLLNERLGAYRIACRTAGEIVNFAETKDPDLYKSVNAFEALYWGEIGLFEDSIVVEAGKRFRFECKNFQQSNRGQEALNDLKLSAINFTAACQKSNLIDWQKLLAE